MLSFCTFDYIIMGQNSSKGTFVVERQHKHVSVQPLCAEFKPVLVVRRVACADIEICRSNNVILMRSDESAAFLRTGLIVHLGQSR